MPSDPICILLGPQQPTANVSEAMRACELRATNVALITAGWQEAEDQTSDLIDALGVAASNLELYRRSDEVFASDPELASAYRQRQSRLQRIQELYRKRLAHLMRAVHDLHGAPSPSEDIAAELDHAFAQVRELDRRHLAKTRAIHDAFALAYGASTRDVLAAHREELAARLSDCDAVAIAGGNVAVLANRMRLFDVGPLLEGTNLIAWSAGAMVLTERIVLYHDRLPLARRSAEMMLDGFGYVSRVVAFPNATARLRVASPSRVAVVARRFEPDRCLALDSGSAIAFRSNDVVYADNVRRFAADGALTGTATA